MKKQSRAELPDSAELTDRLRGHARKVTGPRRAILALLSEETHPLTIRDIHKLLAHARCDLATVYRSMRMLEETNMVQRFDFGDGVARFELVRQEEHGHHHHLICTDCAKVVEIEDCFPAELEKRIAQGNGFKAIKHKLEFFGICPTCQSK